MSLDITVRATGKGPDAGTGMYLKANVPTPHVAEAVAALTPAVNAVSNLIADRKKPGTQALILTDPEDIALVHRALNIGIEDGYWNDTDGRLRRALGLRDRVITVEGGR